MSVEAEVTAKPASTDPNSLQNGLGLEALLPATGPITKPSSASKAAPKSEKVTQPDVEPVDVKPTPVKKVVADEKPATDIPTLEKRLKDTRDAFTKSNQEKAELKRQLNAQAEQIKVLTERMDGTYVAPTALPPDQQSFIDKFMGRIEVDRAILEEEYTPDVIQKLLFDADSPYQQIEIADPSVRQRIQNAKRPVQEAMKVLKEREFYAKYGNDPDRIREALLAEERESLTAEIRKELKGKPIESVHSVSGMNGASRDEQRKEPVRGTMPDLDKAFPTFANKQTV